MFNSYDNIPSSYTPCNSYSKSIVSDKKYRQPFEEYDNQENFIGYGWRYGEAVVLEFNTEGDVTHDDFGVYETAAVYLSGKKMTLTIYNFRYEVVFTETVDSAECVKFYLGDSEHNTLVKGLYKCSLVLSDNSGITFELVRPDDYTIVVK